MDYKRLSRTIAFALRHKPWVYELELDAEGWVDVAILLDALRNERHEWQKLSITDIKTMIAQADKERYELADDRIRARYGHSAINSIQRTASRPPETLWHGTSLKVLEVILENGLLPMKRQYVHYSIDKLTAVQVAQRKGNAMVLLTVASGRAYADGIPFYQGNAHVWLSDALSPRYLSNLDE